MRQALHTNLKLHLIDAQRVRFVYTALAHQSAFVYALDKTRHKHASADHDHVHADAVQTDKVSTIHTRRLTHTCDCRMAKTWFLCGV
jgi:hypothetical protein